MLKNYFVVAFRNFWRNKLFSFINVLGLSVGVSAALVIFLIVHFEFSFDHFQQDKERIYHVVMDVKFNGDAGHSGAVPAPLGEAIQHEVSTVALTVPVMQFQGDGTVKVTLPAANPDKQVVYKKQRDIVFTNDQYFQLIAYNWIASARPEALSNPFSVVLSESRAHQYFPGVPLAEIPGKRITYNDDLHTTVTGVVKDLIQNSDFTGEEFISLSTISKTVLQNQFMMTVWNDWMAYSRLFVKLSSGSTPAQTETQLKVLLAKYNKDANKDNKNSMVFRLQPLSDMHFNADYIGFGQRIAHKPTLFSLLAIAGFLLLLACINFINLTTAHAAQRAKEIGIRKTIGGSKKQLVFQFLSETFLITLVSTVLSVILTPLLLALFADFIPPGLHLDLIHEPALLLFLLGLAIVVSFLSGMYPAIILSGYRPALVLKNQAFAGSGQARSAWIRKTLTIAQFVIAQFFIIATFVVSKQVHYSLNKDLGYRKAAILNFQIPFDTVAVHQTRLLSAIQAIPEVELASLGFFPPANEGAAFSNIRYEEGKNQVKVNVQIRWGDSNYIKLYQIHLLAGRNVQSADRTKEILVNETYARALGFNHPEDALNKLLTNYDGKKLPIVGVMRDFHEQSLRGVIGPLVFESSTSGFIFHVALRKENSSGTIWPSAISKINKAFKRVYPEDDFSYSFYDESLAKFYAAEQQTSRLLKWSAGLAMLICCLGLLGLVIYTTNNRTKEIGIRKILGASVSSIVSILARNFIGLILIGTVIAIPISWWASSKWLENFAYRTAMNWWIFALSALVMIGIAILTLSLQTIKAAIANPVNALRSE
jgi:putative ABC transport system permease protein